MRGFLFYFVADLLHYFWKKQLERESGNERRSELFPEKRTQRG